MSDTPRLDGADEHMHGKGGYSYSTVSVEFARQLERELSKLDEEIERLKAERDEAVQAEREACAKVCDARYMGDNSREDMEAKRCAAAIRARGQEPPR